jgi:hypothetical protein
VPTDSGDVGLNTRSMCRNRSGRPRSWIRNPTDAIAPLPAVIRATLVSAGRPLRSAIAPSTDDVPAAPPRNRYSGTSGVFHTGGLMIGRP